MKVQFMEDWRGSKVGDVEDLNDDFCTLDLIPRKIVKPVDDTQAKKIKEQAAEIAKLKRKLKAKQINAAPKNKMVEVAAETKAELPL